MTSGGTCNATIQFEVAENTNINGRNGFITASTIDNTTTVSVAQNGAFRYISATPSMLEFVYTGGTNSIAVSSNAPWTATTSSDWVTLSQSAGTGNATVGVTTNAYTGDTQSGTIIFKTDDETVNVSVVQYGTIPYLYFDREILDYDITGGTQLQRVNSNIKWFVESVENIPILPISLNTSYIEAPVSGGSYSVNVISDYKWVATTSSDWINISETSGMGNATIAVTLNNYGGLLIRRGTIVFETLNGSVELEVTQSVNMFEIPLTFEPQSAGYVSWKSNKGSNSIFPLTIEYRINGGAWTSVTSTQNGVNINFNEGDIIQFRGNNERYSSTDPARNGWNNLNCSVPFAIYGNIMSLVNSDNYISATTVSSYAFYSLFDSARITKANNLKLPATTLANYCYYYMFNGCSSLTTAPELSATTLASYCYESMFANCTSLTTAPELPATTLAYACYVQMFLDCTNLVNAPSLPATELASYCYSNMFNGCRNLIQAPELPATTLASYCYSSMFRGCTSLTTAPSILPATTLADYCYQYMFKGCTSLVNNPSSIGTSATTMAESACYYMFSGCTSLRQAPELPVETLAPSCYSNMFNGCRNLNYIKCLATDISALGCTAYWVSGVASSGTFVKPASTDWSSKTGTGTGIPRGWTIINI